ncbi:unnamed protein product [Durusdinium trenchii]|uniref:Uncharacterized protein n=1 Tax=Durusdinium trenchii TaxID=1381693 RepID=A0ABP0H7X8_9DINO
MDGLRQRWRLGDSEEEKGWEACAAQAAELFRLKDTVASLYAWGLLPRKTGRQLLDAMTQEMKMAPRILDPIAGTGLHAARGTRFFGVILADSVHGGSTQSSGADTQYLQQCISSGSSARAAAAAQTAAAQAAVAAAGPALVWAELQHLDIFDAGEAAAAWWQQHGEAPNAVLMLSFPPPPPSEVAEAALRRFGGRWVLFIGEWRGCTGSKAFFDRLEAEWRLLGTFEVPRWPMMEDPMPKDSRAFEEVDASDIRSKRFDPALAAPHDLNDLKEVLVALAHAVPQGKN